MLHRCKIATGACDCNMLRRARSCCRRGLVIEVRGLALSSTRSVGHRYTRGPVKNGYRIRNALVGWAVEGVCRKGVIGGSGMLDQRASRALREIVFVGVSN